MPDGSLIACDLLRNADYDRYLAAMLAPAAKRESLFALYALNVEAAKASESVREPLAAAIRLQWWREAVERLYEGQTSANPILAILGQTIAAHSLPAALFATYFDAREKDLEETPFTDRVEWENYAAATSGTLMRLAARVLGAGDSLDEVAMSAGTAHAMMGLTRSLPFHAARRRLLLPLSAVTQAGLSPEEIFSRADPSRIAQLVQDLTGAALDRLPRAAVPRRFLPALLPASLARLQARLLRQAGFDPYCAPLSIPFHRRQIAMLSALIRGQL